MLTLQVLISHWEDDLYWFLNEIDKRQETTNFCEIWEKVCHNMLKIDEFPKFEWYGIIEALIIFFQCYSIKSLNKKSPVPNLLLTIMQVFTGFKLINCEYNILWLLNCFFKWFIARIVEQLISDVFTTLFQIFIFFWFRIAIN